MTNREKAQELVKNTMRHPDDPDDPPSTREQAMIAIQVEVITALFDIRDALRVNLGGVVVRRKGE